MTRLARVALLALIFSVGCACEGEKEIASAPSARLVEFPAPSRGLEVARAVARAGIPSTTPELDALTALANGLSPRLGLEDLLDDSPDTPPPVLRAGDVIEVIVAGRAEFSGGYTIAQDGFIELLLAGQLRAAGLTVRQLTKRLHDRLDGTYLRAPEILVKLRSPAAQKVIVYGRVHAHLAKDLTSSLILLPTDRRLSVYELLDNVQGLAPDADASCLVLLRLPLPDAPPEEDDLRPTEADGPASPRRRRNVRFPSKEDDLPPNPEGRRSYHFSYAELLAAHVLGRRASLRPGDRLVVPRLPQVSILGEVNRPGRYPVRPGSTIASLLLAADGLTLRAYEREIHLLSGEQTRRATLEAPVEDGDVIFVASLGRVYVVGEGVRRSGPVSIPPNGLNALQAIAEAGWFAPEAGRVEVEILRESEGRTLRIPVPIDEILAGERDPSEFPLLPADTLRVSASWW